VLCYTYRYVLPEWRESGNGATFGNNHRGRDECDDDDDTEEDDEDRGDPRLWGAATYAPLQMRPVAQSLGVDAGYPTWGPVAAGAADPALAPAGWAATSAPTTKPDPKKQLALRHISEALRGRPPAFEQHVSKSVTLSRAAEDTGFSSATALAIDFATLVAKRRRLRTLMLTLAPPLAQFPQQLRPINLGAVAAWMVKGTLDVAPGESGKPHDDLEASNATALAHVSLLCHAAARSAVAKPSADMLVCWSARTGGGGAAKSARGAFVDVMLRLLREVGDDVSPPPPVHGGTTAAAVPLYFLAACGKRLIDAYTPLCDDFAAVAVLQRCGYGSLLLAPSNKTGSGGRNFWTDLVSPGDWLRGSACALPDGTALMRLADLYDTTTDSAATGRDAPTTASTGRFIPDRLSNAGPSRESVEARLDVIAWHAKLLLG
jgi:hypothetical protein